MLTKAYALSAVPKAKHHDSEDDLDSDDMAGEEEEDDMVRFDGEDVEVRDRDVDFIAKVR